MKPTVDDWSIERIVSRSGPPAPTDTALIRRALDKGDDQCKDDAERPITRAMLMSRTGLP